MLTVQGVPGLELGEVIGQGGFATVYRAQQVALQRDVAVKIDHRVLATDRRRRRFEREIDAVTRLSGHPHVVTVHDAGMTSDWRPYLVMELCPAGSLQQRLDAEGALPWPDVLDVGVGLAAALAAAHRAGVVHRDVKPANVLQGTHGRALLSDFGIAEVVSVSGPPSATREAWTPGYVAPEVVAGGPPSPASDLYSLAVTLHALLAGGRPTTRQAAWAGGNPFRGHDLPDLPGVPAALTGALRAAGHPDPRRRTGTVEQFRERLLGLRQAVAAGRVLEAPHQVLAPGRRRARWLAGTATAACLGVAAAALIHQLGGSRPVAGGPGVAQSGSPAAVRPPAAGAPASGLPTAPVSRLAADPPLPSPGTPAATPDQGPRSSLSATPRLPPPPPGYSTDGSLVAASLAGLQRQLGPSARIVAINYSKPAGGYALVVDVITDPSAPQTLHQYASWDLPAQWNAPWRQVWTHTNSSGSPGIPAAGVSFANLGTMVATARNRAASVSTGARAQWRYSAAASGIPAGWSVVIPVKGGGYFSMGFPA